MLSTFRGTFKIDLPSSKMTSSWDSEHHCICKDLFWNKATIPRNQGLGCRHRSGRNHNPTHYRPWAEQEWKGKEKETWKPIKSGPFSFPLKEFERSKTSWAPMSCLEGWSSNESKILTAWRMSKTFEYVPYWSRTDILKPGPISVDNIPMSTWIIRKAKSVVIFLRPWKKIYLESVIKMPNGRKT